MRKLASLAAFLAVAAAACGGGSGLVAASVDGADITVGDVNSLIDSDGATVTKAQFAQFLSFSIQWEVIFPAAEADYGITTTDEEAIAEADRIFEEVAAEGQTREDFLSGRGVTEEFLLNIARQGLLDIEIREILTGEVADPTTEEVEAARQQAEIGLTTACVSHILVETEEEAQEALDRLEAGEEFGALATELSTDTGSAANNGILPCSAPGEYVEPFRDAVLAATVGEVVPEPVESEFGFHVILVTDLQEPAAEDFPTDEELADSVRDAAVIEELEAWFLGALEDADVTVGEEYGTWQANPPQVVAPVD